MTSRDGLPPSPTDGNRTDTTNSGLKVGLPVIGVCVVLLLVLIALAVAS